MKTLYLGSVMERSGKTTVSLGLACNGPGKIGYYKPFRENLMSVAGRTVDQDAYLMERTMGTGRAEDLAPCTYDLFDPVDMGQVVEGFELVSKGRDHMLVEGTRDITTGYMNEVSGLAISSRLNADVILVAPYTHKALDRVIMFAQLCRYDGLRLKGVILNACDDDRATEMLENKGIAVLGRIPTSSRLKEFTVSEVVEALDAEVMVGGDLDRPVQEVMVAAMSPATAMRHMRLVRGKAVLTGGDRTDVQMVALDTDTACLVLTGGQRPASMVVSKAYDRGIPLLLTNHQTIDAAELVDNLIARLDPDDQDKVELVSRLVRDNVDIDAVWDRS